ncbi:MAG: CDP-6-deoxy-delta-3,4-glucoseen reductase, partial [Betaproteobacteria bacterium]|nr:CDP-6-deoxy-delta-3,4-glucoseen reductase [Betaproteobacteria bacterium]
MNRTITVLPAGHRFEVEDTETVLAAAIRQGVGLPYGCQDGACGSCKCRWISGDFELGPHQAKALSEAERLGGMVLTCRMRPQGDVVIECAELPSADVFPPRKMPCRVQELEFLASDVARLRLQLPANEVFRYHAGQYLQFVLRDGSRRSYSMANAPSGQPSVDLHIRHMPGGKFTDQVFGSLKLRDILRMEGPFGSFYLRDDSDKPLVLLASGTGLAPIKAILEQLRAQGSTREAHLYWGGRKQADLYLMDWAREQAEELAWLKFVPVLSEPDAHWQGRTGFVHRAVMADLPDLSGFEVYACGSPLMVEAARSDFGSRCGLPAEAFHADAFTSEADKAGA